LKSCVDFHALNFFEKQIIKMTLLGIKTSGKILSAAVCEDEKVLSEITFEANRSHSVDLLPTVKAVLEEAGVTLSGIDGIAVDIGPGSYTGIRIGIATAKGLAFPEKIPVCGVSSLEAAAGKKKAAVLRHARGKLYYAAVFDCKKRLTPDSIVDIDEYQSELAKYHDFEIIENETDESAVKICQAALGKKFIDASALKAAYLEPTKAEKELN
jgi:tRNA threonylcarbamoyl adenosine modification protein YeaZ